MKWDQIEKSSSCKKKKLKLKFNQFSAGNECHLCHGNRTVETKNSPVEEQKRNN